MVKKVKEIEKNKVKFGGIKALLYYKIKYQIIIVIINLEGLPIFYFPSSIQKNTKR